MNPNRAGRFRARVMDVGVNETGPNKLCTIVFRFALTEEYLDGEWRNIEPEELDIVAYCYLEKKNGALNEFQIAALKDAFNWSGMDPFWFEGNSQLPAIQITLDWEEYQGKQRIKVKFINSYDSEPTAGITHADPDQRRSLLARLGHKLRAHAGGKPAPAPKPTGAPTPPPKPATAVLSSMDEAWSQFSKWAELKSVSQEDLNRTWFAAIKAVCGHEDAEKVTPEQWAKVINEIRTFPSDF